MNADTPPSPTDISEEMVEAACAEAWGSQWATLHERHKAQERREAKGWAKLFAPILRAQDAVRIADLENRLRNMSAERDRFRQDWLKTAAWPSRLDSLERENRVLREALRSITHVSTPPSDRFGNKQTFKQFARSVARAALASTVSPPTRTPTDIAEGIWSGAPVEYYPSTGESDLDAPAAPARTDAGEVDHG